MKVEKLKELFSKTKVTVVGDIMLDKYIIGSCNRISQEAPVPVVVPHSEVVKLGGAANVAMNLVELGAEVTIYGSVGDDEDGKAAVSMLKPRTSSMVVKCGGKTNTKMRVMTDSSQIVRIDRGEDRTIDSKTEDAVCSMLSHVRGPILISDYCKGFVTEQVVNACKNMNIIVADIKKWREHYGGIAAITPNTKEWSSIEKEIRASGSVRPDVVLVTMGSDGVGVIYDESEFSFGAHHIPDAAIDTCGAGDTVVAVFTLCLSCGISPLDSAWVANVAGGISVTHAGVYPVGIDELCEKIQEVDNEL